MTRYLSVLSLAARGELADLQGRTWPDLTDAEAAAWIGLLFRIDAPDPSDIQRTRGLLMGQYADPLQVAGRPLAQARKRRTCRVSGQDAMSYRISEKLFGFEPMEVAHA